jgi:hypothetical protein
MAELLQGSTWTGWVMRYIHDPDVISDIDAIFQEDSAPIHTAGTVQSWFEEHEGELQHLTWSAQSPDLNIVESL